MDSPASQELPTKLPPRIVRDAVCVACGCLCDDIVLEVETDRIVSVSPPCPAGDRWFLAERSTQHPPCSIQGIQGESVTEAAAVSRAAEILATAKRPLFFGLEGASCEAQRAAIALADSASGATLVAGGKSPYAAAVRSVGQISATLGEVRHRADVILFWCVDPATTHPRHFERYSLDSRGRFVPHGRAGRTSIVVDTRPTETSNGADLFVQTPPGNSQATLALLRGFVSAAPESGAESEDDRAAPEQTHQSAAHENPRWSEVVDRMKQARYGAIFFDPASLVVGASDPQATCEEFLLFVRALNAHTRWVALPLARGGNAAGARQVLAWQAAPGGSVDFSGPLPHDPQLSLEECLEAGEFDAALLVAHEPITDPLRHLSPRARQQLAHLPLVVLHTGDMAPPDHAAVTFRVATPGIDCAGTLFRSDGVALPLRAALDPSCPTGEAILARIERALLDRGGNG